MIDIVDVIKNVDELITDDMKFKILKDFERVIDNLDMYVFNNWEDGELVVGPFIHRHTVICKFMWPYEKMPDPAPAMRLIDYGCKVSYERTNMLVPRKVHTPDDFRPGTKKGKIDKVRVWVVTISMPKSLMQDIYQGQQRIQSEYVKDHISLSDSPDLSDNEVSAEGEGQMPQMPQMPQEQASEQPM